MKHMVGLSFVGWLVPGGVRDSLIGLLIVTAQTKSGKLQTHTKMASAGRYSFAVVGLADFY